MASVKQQFFSSLKYFELFEEINLDATFSGLW